MIRKIIFAILIIAAGSLIPKISYADDSNLKIVVYFFWGEGCPHCAHEKPLLEKLKTRYPGLVVNAFEVWHNKQNNEIYQRMATAYDIAGGNVPATFIDTRVWIGFNEEKSKEIEAAVSQCAVSACIDPAERRRNLSLTSTATTPPMSLTGTFDPVVLDVPKKPDPPETSKVQVPFIGSVDTSRISLPVLTLILAGLDGFNPCAFFVLLMLLSLMVHAQSRMKMLLVGGVFVFFSGFIYFLFMAAWLNLFMVTGQVSLITTGAGAIAILIALINIKDFFFFKQGVSLTLSEKAQASLLTRMRSLIKTGSMAGIITGTIVLAVMANLYELLCTAGFPMVFTRALTLENLSRGQYYLYLVFYNAIYILPLLTIVIIFASTLGSRKLTEEEGRTLKLVSGLMMLGLGGIFIIRPALLNNIFVSCGLIAGVLVTSAVIIRFKKYLLPERSKGHH